MVFSHENLIYLTKTIRHQKKFETPNEYYQYFVIRKGEYRPFFNKVGLGKTCVVFFLASVIDDEMNDKEIREKLEHIYSNMFIFRTGVVTNDSPEVYCTCDDGEVKCECRNSYEECGECEFGYKKCEICDGEGWFVDDSLMEIGESTYYSYDKKIYDSLELKDLLDKLDDVFLKNLEESEKVILTEIEYKNQEYNKNLEHEDFFLVSLMRGFFQ